MMQPNLAFNATPPPRGLELSSRRLRRRRSGYDLYR